MHTSNNKYSLRIIIYLLVVVVVVRDGEPPEAGAVRVEAAEPVVADALRVEVEADALRVEVVVDALRVEVVAGAVTVVRVVDEPEARTLLRTVVDAAEPAEAEAVRLEVVVVAGFAAAVVVVVRAGVVVVAEVDVLVVEAAVAVREVEEAAVAVLGVVVVVTVAACCERTSLALAVRAGVLVVDEEAVRVEVAVLAVRVTNERSGCCCS